MTSPLSQITPGFQHLLIIRLSSFGDVAMTVPAIGLLRNKFPKMKITILTTEFFSVLFNQIPNINFIFFKPSHKTLIGLYSLSKDINNANFTCVIDLHNVLRTKLLSFFCFLSKLQSLRFLRQGHIDHLFNRRPRFILDKGRKEKKALIAGDTFKQLKSMHQRYIDVFNKLIVEVFELNIKLDLKFFKYYKKVDISDKNYKFNVENKIIGIAPFAGHICKEYSLTKIIEIIAHLNDIYEILIFGAPGDEAKKIKEICKSNQNTHNISTDYSLEEQMGIISNLDLMISMDSANGHIASLFGINVLTIWGATHPFTGYGPYMQPKINSIIPDRKNYHKLPVTIYGSNCPKDYLDAINSIKTEKILKRIEKII